MPRGRTGARRPSEPKVVGAADAAAILGVRQSNLRARRGLPVPYDTIRSTTLWREADIIAYRDGTYDGPVMPPWTKPKRDETAEAA